MGDDIRVTVVAPGLGRARKGVQLVQTPMLRTGTHNEPMMGGSGLNASMGQSAQPAASFDGLKAPAVWRRESASDTVRALEKNGMETYDIPAFLRKQAD
jgi:cell division protein FtsZ